MTGHLPLSSKRKTLRENECAWVSHSQIPPRGGRGGKETRQCSTGPSHCSALRKPGTTGCTHTPEAAAQQQVQGSPGFLRPQITSQDSASWDRFHHSSISTPAANFSSLVPAPCAHLDLLPALVQLLGAQGGLSGQHFAFALLQPLPHGPHQLPKLIQLLLAGRCILFSGSEKVLESQSSCFALQLPVPECSTVVFLEALYYY